MSLIDNSAISHARAIGFLGLGVSNIGAISYIKKTVPDVPLILRSDTPIKQSVIDKYGFSAVFTGNAARRSISEDILFLSPTVRRDSQEMLSAAKCGVILTSDLELFLGVFQNDYIAVSGTDGKSTLTYLISRLLSESARASVPAGNYGKSVCDLIGKSLTPVVELSSFQLTYTEPHASLSCLTNVFNDHADWHKDAEEYRHAKSRVLSGAKLRVVDIDLVDRELIPDEIYAAVSLTGRKADTLRGLNCDYLIGYNEGFITVNGTPYADIRSAPRRETYNIRNYMHLAAVSLSYGDAQTLSRVTKGFTGIAHRCEHVAQKNGIRYINSSIDTSPSRTLSTLRELSGRVALILGGRSKGLSLDVLSEYVRKRDIPCVLIGECREEYERAFSPARTVHAYSMDEAVRLAVRLLDGDGTVLLSPAAQSYGDYASFEERGEDFRRAVKEIIKK